MQAAFTIKEVRELMKLPPVAFHPVDESLIPEDIKSLPRPTRRIMEVLKKGSGASASTAPKSWSLDFCLSPTGFNSSAAVPNQIGSLTFEQTRLVPNPFDLKAKAESTGEAIDIPASLAFRSIGYKSEGLPGFSELGIPFEDRLGIIPNDHLGRVINDNEGCSESSTAKTIPGMYCAGWVKRGPTGVIASTMEDAFSTAESITMDWYGHLPFLNEGKGSGLGWHGVKEEAEKRGCRRVSWGDWKRIDAVEKTAGQKKGKEREKFTKVEDMLAVLD
jgi:adrenodoxin-NADP+ reductase